MIGIAESVGLPPVSAAMQACCKPLRRQYTLLVQHDRQAWRACLADHLMYIWLAHLCNTRFDPITPHSSWCFWSFLPPAWQLQVRNVDKQCPCAVCSLAA